jgi:hypothetical protein
VPATSAPPQPHEKEKTGRENVRDMIRTLTSEEPRCQDRSSSLPRTGSRKESSRASASGCLGWEFIQENDARLLAFNEYGNEEGTEAGVVQLHRDARMTYKCLHLGGCCDQRENPRILSATVCERQIPP